VLWRPFNYRLDIAWYFVATM